MTNKEWLDYLAHNAPDELAAWFDAEHVENQERALDGDTEPENEDSREKLEAEASELVADYAASGEVCDTMYNGIIELLDRQAAITEREMYRFDENHREHIRSLETINQKLNERIAELTADRDKLQEQLLIGWECECRLQAERERYRSKFGKCLDYADAIHALMDDEGMA